MISDPHQDSDGTDDEIDEPSPFLEVVGRDVDEKLYIQLPDGRWRRLVSPTSIMTIANELVNIGSCQQLIMTDEDPVESSSVPAGVGFQALLNLGREDLADVQTDDTLLSQVKYVVQWCWKKGKNVANRKSQECQRFERLPKLTDFEWLPSDFAGQTLRSFDLFAGGGGNALGLKKAGIVAHTAVENCMYATVTYENIHPDALVFQRDAVEILESLEDAVRAGATSITTHVRDLAYRTEVLNETLEVDEYLDKSTSTLNFADEKGLPFFQMFHTSPPCNGFSGANAAAGQERLQHGSGSVEQTEHYTDTVPRYAKILKTPFITVEMVDSVSNRGISRGSNGAIQQLVTKLMNLGYQVSCSVLFAPEYGCPQNRTRYIVFGAKRNFALPDMPKPTHSTFRSGLVRAGARTYSSQFAQSTVRDAISDLPTTLSVDDDCLAEPYLTTFDEDTGDYAKTMREDYVFAILGMKSEVQGAISSRSQGKPLVPVVLNHRSQKLRGKIMWPKDEIQNATDHDLVNLVWSQPSATCYGGTKMLHPERTRLLTVREHARLQGFPDYVVFAGKIERQYKTVNNAVPVQLAKAIGETIRAASKAHDYNAWVQHCEAVEAVELGVKSEADLREEERTHWRIEAVYAHKLAIKRFGNPDAVRANGETCRCFDCTKLKRPGPGFRYEVGYNAYWQEQGYGRDAQGQGEAYWQSDVDMVCNEPMLWYATQKYGRRPADEKKRKASSSSQAPPKRRMEPESGPSRPRFQI